MKFKINNTEWIIKEVEKNEFDLENVLGETDYEKQEIRIWKECKNKNRTLKHELCHVFLWEYAQTQREERKYDYEEVCEIVACSNDFINEVVEKYKQESDRK